jgi:hypothetical protein
VNGLEGEIKFRRQRKERSMPEFDETAGEFVRNLIHSLQEEVERLPSPVAMMDLLRELDPTPEQIGTFVGKAVEVAAKAAGEIAQGVRKAGEALNDQAPDFDGPDDLRDLG